ncbi:hypothetical protein C1A_384 [Wolbachia endosymbiont of Culex quinquefasciatus JHB]|uniref:hypothetical protein n=1 Tax=Wolbachia TaxID=953 RepID=UPI0001761E90|nr:MULTISPECIES: hypothetical protein [Wolbachia]EEB56202.1 hypothetical protein C1A_384 [Wolbachia endosymbiont of Culex quinquefasciatus JHB]QEK89401.1 hypothetical protein CAI20_01430 [Wolbachia endosymbiont of Chrysomya megacephala]CAQ54918.1 hypothetical protein WP0810 [Wolbachia endosymbiont of Culex quinquefasciatus Pel]CQD09349.1 Uncharacterised protein [Wolbachia endosymbiont wPip_Mol of Culex molestus]
MSDLFYIESECCVDGQCDTYAGEVSINDVMLGKFSLNSHSGKKAMVNIDIVTFDIHIAMDGQDGKTIKRDLKSPEFVIKDDGSWYINKNLGNDKFEIIVKQS